MAADGSACGRREGLNPDSAVAIETYLPTGREAGAGKPQKRVVSRFSLVLGLLLSFVPEIHLCTAVQ